MIDSICGFIKIFCEKIWFWLVVSLSTVIALFSDVFFNWLGFNSNSRWIVGGVAILSLSLALQNICDFISSYIERKDIIDSVNSLPKAALEVLNNIVRDNKRTLKVKDNDWLEQKRIISQFKLKIVNGYVTFPRYLWKALKKKGFGDN